MHAVRRCSHLIVLALFCSQGHAAAELSLSKTVSTETPAVGEPVEFTITVDNAGPDAAADVHVTDLLPNGLGIPAGLAAFVSQGTYDVATGDWALGDVPANGAAVMALPAIANVAPQPACLVNEAAIEESAADPGRRRETSLAAVRNGVSRCVDLEVNNANFEVPQPSCSNDTTAHLSFTVRNNGPHEARNVVVGVTQSPAMIPDFHFTSSNCGSAALRCEIGTLAPGAIRFLDVESKSFHNNNAYSVSITIAAGTSDSDYVSANNSENGQVRIPRTVKGDCNVPGGTAAGCFIATAAWGAEWNGNVRTLRDFRDRFLLTNAPGRAFVRWYYRVSPPIADFIAESPARRAAVRAALTPIVLGIRHPAGTILVLILVPAAWLFWRRRRQWLS